MLLPIDVSEYRFIAAGTPEPALNFDTKLPQLDKAGRELSSIRVVAMSPSGAEVLVVKVSNATKGIVQGSEVRIIDLVAIPWRREQNAGISFRASSVELATPARSAS